MFNLQDATPAALMLHSSSAGVKRALILRASRLDTHNNGVCYHSVYIYYIRGNEDKYHRTGGIKIYKKHRRYNKDEENLRLKLRID